MKLIIAEKPSVGSSIAKVLGVKNKKDGYYENDAYIISWCVGHLIGLAQSEAYDEKYKKWSITDLPVIPENWLYSVNPATKKQFEILKKLMLDKRVSVVVNGADAGREGELIFRLLYNMANCTKPMKRLWISSMEDSAILDGLENLKNGSDYDNLFASAKSRQQADWLVGINATRLFSCLYGTKLNVGRVQTPTLSLIVERDHEIHLFKKETFYTPVLTCKDFNFKANGEKSFDKIEVLEKVKRCRKTATVTKVDKKEKVEKPPKLYDLTTLQREANRTFGYTASQTLELLQALYEKKLATYPRTDSSYITEDMRESTLILIDEVVDKFDFLNGFSTSKKIENVINNKKVSDHHAILPTLQITKEKLDSLPSSEKNILTMVSVKLLSAVGGNFIYDETKIEIACGDMVFKTTGKMINEKGFKVVEGLFKSTFKIKSKDKLEEEPTLCVEIDFCENQVLENISIEIAEGTTTPPKQYTEDTLLSAMQCAGQKDDTPKEFCGLGTPATRAGIIENLVKNEYLQRVGEKKVKSLIPTKKGINLITVLPQAIKSPKLTAEWEECLANIEKGEKASDDFMGGIADFTHELVSLYKDVKTPPHAELFPSDREIIGICPRCGKPVFEGKLNFYCQNKECDFALWKENKFFSTKKKTLTKDIAIKLLANGKVKMTNLFSEKKNSTYDATIVLDDTGEKYVNFKLEF